jgi:membrane protein DedA with SNARE-associated domain
MAELMIDHAAWLLFIWVLVNQAGLPVPVVPSLLAAGALSRSTSLEFTAILAVVVMASLCADLAWYGLGRWRGTKMLGVLRRLLPRPGAPIDRVASLFRAHQVAFLMGARFLPELNPVAAGLAGTTGVGLTRYLLYAAGSALVWAGAWAGLGYLLGEALAASPALVGTVLPVLVVSMLLAAAGSALVIVSSQAIARRSLSAVSISPYRAAPGDGNISDERAARPEWAHGASSVDSSERPGGALRRICHAEGPCA